MNFTKLALCIGFILMSFVEANWELKTESKKIDVNSIFGELFFDYD